MHLAVRATLLAAALVIAGCGSEVDQTPENVLSGTATLNGQPIPMAMIVAVGPDGQEVAGPLMADGRYMIANPPTGPLRFKFLDAPTGGPAPRGPARMPARYLKPDNELTVEYVSGRQTYNIDLKSNP